MVDRYASVPAQPVGTADMDTYNETTVSDKSTVIIFIIICYDYYYCHYYFSLWLLCLLLLIFIINIFFILLFPILLFYHYCFCHKSYILNIRSFKNNQKRRKTFWRMARAVNHSYYYEAAIQP